MKVKVKVKVKPRPTEKQGRNSIAGFGWGFGSDVPVVRFGRQSCLVLVCSWGDLGAVFDWKLGFMAGKRLSF